MHFSGRKPSGLCFFHQLALARLKLFAKLLKVDIGLARLGEHAVALLFLFLDVMLDLLLKNKHLGVIIFPIGLGLLKLQNQRSEERREGKECVSRSRSRWRARY